MRPVDPAKLPASLQPPSLPTGQGCTAPWLQTGCKAQVHRNNGLSFNSRLRQPFKLGSAPEQLARTHPSRHYFSLVYIVIRPSARIGEVLILARSSASPIRRPSRGLSVPPTLPPTIPPSSSGHEASCSVVWLRCLGIPLLRVRRPTDSHPPAPRM